MLAVVAVNFANVVARYGFGRSIFWADEAMIFMIIWGILVGIIAVTYEDSHLDMNLLAAALPDAIRKPLIIFVSLGTLAIFTLMAWQATKVIGVMARNNQKSIALGIPMTIPHTALLVGFGLSAVAILVRLLIVWRGRSAVELDDHKVKPRI
jgi:TRAP-type transport system small permease protein